jgi:hypothetical protein
MHVTQKAIMSQTNSIEERLFRHVTIQKTFSIYEDRHKASAGKTSGIEYTPDTNVRSNDWRQRNAYTIYKKVCNEMYQKCRIDSIELYVAITYPKATQGNEMPKDKMNQKAMTNAHQNGKKILLKIEIRTRIKKTFSVH